jgi:hypothetical protein
LTTAGKPRVERQVPFVRKSFGTGRSFSSLEAINAGAERWCLTVAGQRRHGIYSIPWRYVGQTLDVWLGARIVPFCAGAELAKTHFRG